MFAEAYSLFGVLLVFAPLAFLAFDMVRVYAH
jgi:hypothetical protein